MHCPPSTSEDTVTDSGDALTRIVCGTKLVLLDAGFTRVA